MSNLVDTLLLHIQATELPAPECEYRFAAVHTGGTGKGVKERLREAGLRDWRFDLAWVNEKLAVEVNGGGFVMGRHSRGTGMELDCAKQAEAMCLGWRVLRVTGRQVKDGLAVKWIERILTELP